MNVEAHRAACKRYYERNKARINARSLEYQRRNRARTRAYRNASNFKSKYGLSLQQLEKLLISQKGKCAICRRQIELPGKGARLSQVACVDHCHNTNTVRSLLCLNCNSAEGHIKTVENARRLYEYMLKSELFYQGEN